MKKVSKKLCSWLMIMAMVLSVAYVQTPMVVKAEEQEEGKSTKVEIGNPTQTGFDKDGLATYKFNDTLKIPDTDKIKSISVQFVSPVIKKDGEKYEYIEYNPDKDIIDLCNRVERLKKTDGNYTHIIINAKNGETLTADDWKTLLIKCFTVHIKIGNVQSVMLSVSEEKVSEKDNLIEYYAYNGHYYEPVQESLSWKDAREASLKAESLDPQKYDSYLVNITSQEENDFVYTICRKSSWIGVTCEPDVGLNGTVEGDNVQYDEKIGIQYKYTLFNDTYNSNHPEKNAYWFYVDGPEAGKLMAYGPAHDSDSNADLTNYMHMAMKDSTYKIVGSALEGHEVEAVGAYETEYDKNGGMEYTNWANYSNWLKSPVYEEKIGYKNVNEPDNITNDERFMAIYSKEDWDKIENALTYPSMWNDHQNVKDSINSYIIEYSLKDGIEPDNDTQSIADLTGEEGIITGKDFSVRGNSRHLTVDSIVSEDKGNVMIQKYNEDPRAVDPEISQEDLDEVNKAIDDNVATDVIVTVKDKSTDLTIRLKITIIPVATISANDFVISVEDAQKADDKSVKENSNARGKDETGKYVEDDKLVVDKDDLTKLNGTKEPDKVTIKLTNTSDIKPTTTVTAHVVEKVNTGNAPDKTEIVIGANNFDISVADVKKALEGDEEILKKLSNVVATAGVENVPTEKIDVDDAYKSDLKPVPGKYPVTFTYDNISVMVEATVKHSNGSKNSKNPGDNNEDKGDGEEITGNDFVVESGSAKLKPDDIIKKGNVKAVDGNGTPINLEPEKAVNPKDLEKLNKAIGDGNIGTYPVKVTTEEGTPVTINVTVMDKVDNTKGDNKTVTDETITANDFNISIDDYDSILGDEVNKSNNVKKYSNAKAYLTELKTPVDITEVDTSKLIKKLGTYPVTLATAKGTSATINVTIDDGAAKDNNKDSGNKNPSVTTGGATVKSSDVVYEKTNPQDKAEPVDPGKSVPATGALKVDGVPVDKYTVSTDGKEVIISKDYIDTLSNGTHQAVLTYTDGTEQKFAITVVDYDTTTVVKNPPLFSMYKEIVLKKNNTFTVNLSGITDYAVVKSSITGKNKNAKKVVSIKQKDNGDVVITPKKVGKSQVTCTIIQNGAEYKVVVDLKVLKQYKGTSKNYNLKTAGLVKTSGELPEFNVYKRIVKGKNTKIKFTKVEKDANVKFYVANKKEAKSLKIGKVKRSGKTVTCTIKGKKKGWVHLTAEITQNGKTYYTRLLVRIDDGTWTSKQLKKYLK